MTSFPTPPYHTIPRDMPLTFRGLKESSCDMRRCNRVRTGRETGGYVYAGIDRPRESTLLTYIAVPTVWNPVCRDLVPTLRQEDRILETRSTKNRRGAEEAQNRRALNKPPAASRRHPSTPSYHLSVKIGTAETPSNATSHKTIPSIHTHHSKTPSRQLRCPPLPAFGRCNSLSSAQTTAQPRWWVRASAGSRPCQIRSAALGRTYHAPTRVNLVRCG